MKGREVGVTLVEMVAVLALMGVLVTLIATHVPAGRVEVQQAMERVVRSVQRARLHAQERNAFTIVTFDPPSQRIVVARLSNADDLESGTPVREHDFTSGALAGLAFSLVDDLDAPAGLLFDPRGVGLGILAAGRFVDAGEMRVAFTHERGGAVGELRVNRYAAVESTGP